MPLSAEQIGAHIRAQLDDEGPKRGEAIFDGTDYPRDWSGFIGQPKAKEQLRIMVGSAKARGVRAEHTLLASGIHGVGKTTLAHLLAYHLGVGLVLAPAGPMTRGEFESLVSDMEPRDVLFIDEAHLLVQGGRTRADWLLPFMTGDLGGLPDVTLLAATTDAGVLPETLLSRFMCTPTIENYTAQEAALIAANLAQRMGVVVSESAAGEIALASDSNPRAMRKILTQIRDLWFAYPDTHPNLDRAFGYAGVSADGLTQVARDILVVLLLAKGTASIDYIKARLGEPGPLKHHEKQLLQRGLIDITGRGRELTNAGAARVRVEIADRQNGVLE